MNMKLPDSKIDEIAFDRIDQCNEYLQSLSAYSIEYKPEVELIAISLNSDIEDEITIKGNFSVGSLPKIYEFLRKKINND